MLTSGPAGVKFCSCLSRSSGILGNRRREKDAASRPRSRDANLRERGTIRRETEIEVRIDARGVQYCFSEVNFNVPKNESTVMLFICTDI